MSRRSNVVDLLLRLKIWNDTRGQDLIEYALMAGFVAASFDTVDREHLRFTTHVVEGIVADCWRVFDALKVRWQAFVVGFHELLGHGNLEDRVFGQGNAHGVANAIREQRTDADGALDAAVFTVTGLGDTEMNGVVPVGAELVEMRNEQTIRFDHDLRIAGLHREEEVVEAMRARNAGEFEGALDHAMR